jgi:hypothetical protein
MSNPCVWFEPPLVRCVSAAVVSSAALGALQGRDEIVVDAAPDILWPLIADSNELPDWGPPVIGVEVLPNGPTEGLGSARAGFMPNSDGGRDISSNTVWSTFPDRRSPTSSTTRVSGCPDFWLARVSRSNLTRYRREARESPSPSYTIRAGFKGGS